MSYMGRQELAHVYEKWFTVRNPSSYSQAIYVYGSRGCNKSHILVRYRVIYTVTLIVTRCLMIPHSTSKNTLFIAFTDSESCTRRECIRRCDIVDDLATYVQYRKVRHLCFIVNQLNRLDS